jgi:predicted RNA-binding Zn ribbon-like protein
MTLPTWVPGTERKPAPAPLLLVQSFVNTRDYDLGTDLLGSGASADGWLRDARLEGPDVTATAAELRLARDFRENVRAMLAGPAGHGGDLHAIEAVSRAGKLHLTVGTEGRIDLSADRPGRLEAGLLELLLIIRDAQHDGTWARLKVCGNEDCRWAFFDRSHSRQGAWCDMASCGNLIKNRNLRARRSSQGAAAS